MIPETEKASLLTAGFGRSEITPRVGVALAGFGPYLNRNARAVEAPLYARAAVLEADGQRVMLVSLDLIGLSRDLEERLRACLAGRSGFPESAICLACTHTHSGPQTAGLTGWGHADDLYLETLPRRVWAAAETALAERLPVTVGMAEVDVPGLAINRDHDCTYDRSVPVGALLDPAWRPPRPELTDTRLRLLVFRHAGRLRGLLHTFACHPVVCCEASTRIHGDFPGLAGARLEGAHPGSVALFIPGALGDVNPPVTHRPERESLRALGVLSGRYTDHLEAGLAETRPLPEAVLRTVSRTVAFTRVDWSLEGIEERILEQETHLHRDGLTDDPLAGGPHPLDRAGIRMVELAGLRRLRDVMRRGGNLSHPVRLQGIRLGPVLLLGSPFEVFQATRRKIENGLPGHSVWVLSLVNGVAGYAPDPEAYRKNRYAAEFVNLMCGDLPHACLHDELAGRLTALGRDLVAG